MSALCGVRTMPDTVEDPWMAMVSAWANELTVSKIMSAVTKPGRDIGHLQRQDDQLSDKIPNKCLIKAMAGIPHVGRSVTKRSRVSSRPFIRITIVARCSERPGDISIGDVSNIVSVKCPKGDVIVL